VTGGGKPVARLVLAHGRKARRLPPASEEVDDRIGVGPPRARPDCGGKVEFDETLRRCQDEVIVKVLHPEKPGQHVLGC
jgi:hypothetical protein